MPIKKEVWVCSYCKKISAVKEQTIINHESWCYANPKNGNNCGHCKYYTKPYTESSGSVQLCDFEEKFYPHYCQKRQLFMLSPKMRNKARTAIIKYNMKKYETPSKTYEEDEMVDYKNKHMYVRCVMPAKCRYYERNVL